MSLGERGRLLRTRWCERVRVGALARRVARAGVGASFLLVLGGAAAATALLMGWFVATPAPTLEKRLPGQEAGLERLSTAKPAAPRNTGTLIPGSGTPSALEGSWPQFRGADRRGVVSVARGLARRWPEEGLRVLWSLEVGEGHAGAAIHRGRVFLLDYDREKQEDALRCLSLDDGEEIWRYTYTVKLKRNHGMSRTVPAVNDQFVVGLGPKCHVHCLDVATGRLIWKMDLVKECGTVVPPWYAGQCPLIDDGKVILAPGGSPLMMAVELSSGRILWRTPNPGDWGMTHSSVLPMDYRGRRQYVYCATRGVIGVAAEDGRALWTKRDWKIALANVPTPVAVGEDRLFLSGGYNSGCAMIRLTGEGDGIETEELFRLKHTVFGSDQQTPILYKEHIYGVIPGGQMACLDLQGNRRWVSGAVNRFGLGPYLVADGLLFALNDQKGTLQLVEATPDAWKPLAAVKVLEGHDAWAPMAIAAGRLILRDVSRLVCLEMQEATP